MTRHCHLGRTSTLRSLCTRSSRIRIKTLTPQTTMFSLLREAHPSPHPPCPAEVLMGNPNDLRLRPFSDLRKLPFLSYTKDNEVHFQKRRGRILQRERKEEFKEI